MNKFTASSFWATVLSLTLLPAVQLPMLLPAVRLDDIIPLVWLVAAVLVKRWVLTPAAQCRTFLMLLFAAIIPISVANGILNGYGGSYGDVNQLVRVIKYLAVYLLSVEYFSQAQIPLWRVAWFGAPLFAICLTQYFNPFGINELYVREIAPTQFVTLVDSYPEPRPVGMVGNPNDAGFLFALLSLAGLFGTLRDRSRTAAILTVVSAAGTLITLSRTAAVALIVGSVLMILIHHVLEFNLRRAVGLIAISLMGAIPVLLNSTITLRLTSVLDYANQLAWSARLNNWRENIDLALEHPILGVGPLRRVAFEHAADNDWLLILRSYGLTGVCAAILLMAAPMVFHRHKSLSLALLAAIFVNMIPSVAFHSAVLFSLALVIMAYSDNEPVGARTPLITQR